MTIPRTMVHALHDTAARMGHRPALWSKRNGTYLPTSWRQYADRVRYFAVALDALGFGPGKVMAILGYNREEWLVSQLAAMALGGVAVGLYTTASPEQHEYVLSHSEAEIIVVEHAAFLASIKAMRSRLPKLRHVIVMNELDAEGGARSFHSVVQEGRAADDGVYYERVDALREDTLAALIYTSGTTGHPKGVMLSHKNLAWTARKLAASAPLRFGEETALSFLPLGHIAEQQGTIHIPIVMGYQVYFAESLEKVPENLKEVRPTVFFAVPRVWEKLKAKAEERLLKASPAQRALIDRARKVTLERHQRLMRKERPPLHIEAQYQAARRAVFAPIKQRIGFDRGEIFVTSAAPIALEVLEFFASIDIIIREVYGQSEVTGPTTVSTEEQTRLGKLGQAMIGVEVKIGDDGEILVRGPNVCLGYYKDPDATSELLQNGWLHSGDLGELDDDGFLRVTGRKKEILVTSGGKKTAPSNIELLLKSISPIGNAMVVGEGRNYLTALLPLDVEAVHSFAEHHGFPRDPAALATDRGFLHWLEQQIEERVNKKIARYEHIRKFRVLPHDFTVDGGELTPTLKVRRKVVEQKYAREIAALYEDARAKSA